MAVDPVELTRSLVACPSVTPAEGGALVALEKVLSAAGFACTRVDRGGICNLFARFGSQNAARTFGFNGHTDVVPIGDEAAWTRPPFGAVAEGDWIYGRGATDMKSGVASFVAAACAMVHNLPEDGAIILTITGDEEGLATDGTQALLDWMVAQNETMDVCIVGEPTSAEALGDMVKIGRRGSLTAQVVCRGKQGHSAYPHKANNPLHAMAQLASVLAEHELDQGTDHFDASTLAITTIDTGNTATNVIPAEARMGLNIRFNDLHSGASLTRWLEDTVAEVAQESGLSIEVAVRISGEAFLTPPGDLSELVSRAVQSETGRQPVLSTTGGTSDARFVKSHCPVVELGVVGHRMHQVDERVSIADIQGLTKIYQRILQDFFA